MHVVLIPFFLAARVVVDEPWKYGPEYTFQVQVNSTAIPEERTYGSVRLNVESKLICQPKQDVRLSCYFRDSKADSFVTESLDPDDPAIPMSDVNRQEAYEMHEDQFEVVFNDEGLDSLVVNENIQPQELDMIRVIVGQMDIGAILGNRNEETFELMENFTQGECVTTFKVERKIIGRTLSMEHGYALESALGLRDDQLVEIQKIRNLHMCTHKVPYFFGSGETLRQVSDVMSAVSASDSHILITSNKFISGTSNVITTSKATEEMITTLHENISLQLDSIQPAEGEPPQVRDAETASILIGRWLVETISEEDSS